MKYSIGLDIGTTSVGWAVINLDKNRIENLGVRIFEEPEDPQSGKSLAEPRRTARSARRRIKRRRQRLNYLKKFFIENKLLTPDEISKILTPHKNAPNPYSLREKGLDEKLTNSELFVALYHIAKRRGYQSNSKAQDEDALKRIAEQKEKLRKKAEEGKVISSKDERLKVLSAVFDNRDFLTEYKTVAGALNRAEKFAGHKRNKADSYQNSFMRGNFEDEARKILNKQRELGLNLSEDRAESLLFGGDTEIRDDGIIVAQNPGIFYQRPFMNSKLLNGMRGNDFYNGEQRAPKASLTFEIFRLAEDIAHIKNAKDSDWTISREQADAIILAAKSVKNLTYAKVREVLGFKNDYQNFEFNYIRGKKPDYKKIKNYEDLAVKEKRTAEIREEEKTTFTKTEFYHEIKTSLKDFPEKFEELEKTPELFDQLGEILTTNKDDENLAKNLHEIGFSDAEIAPLLLTNFSKFGNLSLSTMRKMIPLMLDGRTYDEALEEIYPGKFAAKLSGNNEFLDSPFAKNADGTYKQEDSANKITNPVVKRAIGQTIKVVNAIIRKYGAPTRIGVECARDLARDFSDRMKIKKMQDDNAVENAKIEEILKSEWGIANPTGLQITKWKFYREQDSKCLYSGKPIDPSLLFSDKNYCEIDHIIPFSRCGNDSRANKALVLNSENQEKRDRTPFETWHNDEKRWREFVARIEANPKIYRAKKMRLLAEKLPKEPWSARALTDTQYITKFISDYLRNNLAFAGEKGRQKVYRPQGQITSYLRSRWGLNKSREENNLHHAADAVIVAVTNQARIADIAMFAKSREIKNYLITSKELREKVDLLTGEVLEDELLDKKEAERRAHEILSDKYFPEPWNNFVKELRLRDSELKAGDDLATWRDQFRDLYKDQEDDFRTTIHPIFVSRMPKRNGTGATNQETLRSPSGVKSSDRISYIRKRLTDVKLADLENSPIRNDDKKLYEKLQHLLRENDDDPAKAFANPVYKNSKKIDKNGKPISPVTTIKVDDSKNVKSGILLNDGKSFANNGSTICLDIFSHEKGIFAAPIFTYLAHFEKKQDFTKIAIAPTPNGRSKIEKTYWGNISSDDGKIYATSNNGFEKMFSVFPNDYLIIETKSGEKREGYYVKYGIAGGQMTLINHTSVDKNNENHISVNVGTIAEIHKYDVSILGDNYDWSKK